MNKIFKLSSKQRHWLDFLMAMTEKEIKARYKHAILGFLWVILNPLLQMIVMGFVLQFFVPVHVDNYFLFLFSGLLPWNFFSYSISKATPSIVHERSLIQKANFPREAIILSIVFSNFINLLISMCILIILLVGDKVFLDHYSWLKIGQYVWRMLGVIPLLGWLLMLTSGISLLTAALNVKYRDINFMVRAILPLWFYATPIVYTLNLLPANLHLLFFLNPVTAIIEGFHQTLLTLTPTYSGEAVLISLLMSVLAVYMGWWVFSKESKYFDDWV